MALTRNKHIDAICIAVAALTVVITVLFIFGDRLGLQSAVRTMKYEKTLFDTSYVHQIDIVMDDWEGFLETCEDEEYASCTIVVDGDKHSNVGIRAKGNTSLSSVSTSGSQRYSFKLEFDHYQDGKTMDGLDKLCLNNLIQDNSMLKDYITYMMMADFGVDTPLVSFVYLRVNGEDWGLYLAVEGVEDSFLQRNYGSNVGDLYKPDSLSFGGGRGNGRDFSFDDLDFDFTSFTQTESTETESTQAQDTQTPPGGFDMTSFDPTSFDPTSFDPTSIDVPSNDVSSMGGGMGSSDVKLQYIDDDPDSYSNIFDNAKTDVTSADQKRLISSLKSLSEYTDLEEVLDMDEVLRYFVVHNFVCNGDSYTGSMVHNYYLHESDGKLGMIPWDYNLAFGTFQGGNASSTVNTSIDSPVSGGSVDDRPMVGWIFSDEEYTQAYHELFAEFIERWFTNGELESLIAETAEMIAPYVEKDPTKFCTTEEFEAGVAALSSFVSLRGEAVSRQLSGDTTAVDTSGLNISDMGTMNNVGGGGSVPDMPSGDFDPMGGSMPTIPGQTAATTDTTSATTDAVAPTAQGGMPDMSQMGGAMQGGTMPTMPGQTAATTDTTSATTDAVAPTAQSGMPDMSQMGGAMQGGTMPTMPGQTAATTDTTSATTDAVAPTAQSGMQSGDFDPTTMMTGQMGGAMQSGAMQGGTMPTMPGQTAATTDTTSTTTDAVAPTAQSGMPDMSQMDGTVPSMPGQNGMARGTSSDTAKWILIGVSALVLAVGIFFAIKKKY